MTDTVYGRRVQPERTKAIYTQRHWLRDRAHQAQFRIHWILGKSTYSDYWTTHHPASHHQGMEKDLITQNIVLEMLWIEQWRTEAASVAYKAT